MRNVIAAILKTTALALLALALVAVISACGGSSGGSDDAATGGSDQAAEQVEDGHDEGEAAHEDEDDAVSAEGHSESGQIETIGDELVVTFRTENMKFEPAVVTVKVGQTVRLRLDNHDAFLHDYTVDEPEFVVVTADEFVVLEADGAVHEDHETEAAHDDDEHPAGQVSLSPLHIAAEGNEHAELVFEATDAGEYVFYCSVPGHVEAGMVGKFIIEE